MTDKPGKPGTFDRLIAGIAYLVAGLFGPVIPVLLFFFVRNKSKYAAAHALQGAMGYGLYIVGAALTTLGVFGVGIAGVVADGFPESSYEALPDWMVIGMAASTLPILLTYLVVVLWSLVFATLTFAGRDPRLPWVGRVVDKIVG